VALDGAEDGRARHVTGMTVLVVRGGQRLFRTLPKTRIYHTLSETENRPVSTQLTPMRLFKVDQPCYIAC
jgi:hypothetical protein